MDRRKEIILNFLKSQLLGVIATVDKNNKPESALVGFSETDELEIIFGTFNDTRKFANLQQNPHVAFTISGPKITVQYEGVAKMAEVDEIEKYRAIHLTKNPRAQKVSHHVKQQFFKVTPSWIRYTDISQKPPVIWEITFP